MRVTNFKCLGTQSKNSNFDSDFLKCVNDRVKDIITARTDDLAGVLSEQLTHGEILKVCSGLKSGVSAAAIDYEHIRFGEPSLQKLLFVLSKDSSIAVRLIKCSNPV